MAGKLRLEYEGALYHIMSRGNQRADIFRTDADLELFLKTLGQACEKTDWQIHAWCLSAAEGGGKPLKRLTVAPPSRDTPLKQGVNESGPQSRKNLRCAPCALCEPIILCASVPRPARHELIS